MVFFRYVTKNNAGVQETTCAIATRRGQLLGPYQLFMDFQKLPGLSVGIFKQLIIGQAEIAIKQKNWSWLRKARKNASFFFTDSVISEYLPDKFGKPFKSRQTPEQHYEGPYMARDFRVQAPLQALRKICLNIVVPWKQKTVLNAYQRNVNVSTMC